MRPETTNNTFGKSPHALSKLMQTTILNILILLTWCGWHVQVLCNIYENVDMIRYEAFVIMAETKGVPWQRIRKWCHDNISVSVAHGDTGAKEVWREHVMQGWWGAPDYRVSRMMVARQKRGFVQRTTPTRSKHGHLIHHTCIRPRAVVLGGIPLKHANGTVRVRRGKYRK